MSVGAVLQSKHPDAAPSDNSALLSGTLPVVDPVRFSAVNGDFIRKTAMNLKGAAGPSGMDSHSWRRVCTAFKGASTEICEALAAFARALCTKPISGEALLPFTSCRLIALNKNPGVRPIGVCEVMRRLVVKAAISISRSQIQHACGYIQTCSGLPAGIEAATRVMGDGFATHDTEGVLLVDASNAFNNLNRNVALHNIQYTCPALSLLANNTYAKPARLFVTGGGELASAEGTTQGDPLAMPLYALSTVPLIKELHTAHSEILQDWYADDSAGAGRLLELRRWLDMLAERGKVYGYHVNWEKTQLLVKPEFLQEAERIFIGTGIQIVTSGGEISG